MNKQKILEKALLKAHRNGWKPIMNDWRDVQIEQWQGRGMVGIALLYSQNKAAVTWIRELEGIIFNHDFAKALWGEVPFTREEYRQLESRTRNVLKWQYHLQQMVIADDPIKYLGQNI